MLCKALPQDPLSMVVYCNVIFLAKPRRRKERKITLSSFCRETLKLLTLTITCAAFAAGPSVPAGSKVYIDAGDGFDTYLTAALQKKKVPIVVVVDKEKADYELSACAWSHH